MPPAFVYDGFAITMNIPQYMLRYLLALAICLASVATAAHIHEHEHESEYQIEQCLTFHQLQYGDTSKTLPFNLDNSVSTPFRVYDFYLETSYTQVTPPARGPPIVS